MDENSALLEEAARSVAGLSGATCEIGVRLGDGSLAIMRALNDCASSRPHIGIDPYGNIDYRHWESRVEKIDYTNSMKYQMILKVMSWAARNEYDFVFLPFEDTEFFARFGDGVPFYKECKTLLKEYSLVFFDGPHSVEDVSREIEFFAPRTQSGGAFVFDDINQYAHSEFLDGRLAELGFSLIKKTHSRAWYGKSN